MSVIPKFVIEDWRRKYAPESPLWLQYPELPEASTVLPALVEKDRAIVRSLCLPENHRLLEKTSYTATAGAPLAGKSTILDQEMAANPKRFAKAALIDPDRWGMLFMANSYQKYLMSAGMIANADNFSAAQERAYTLARPGSNFLTLEMLNDAVAERWDIVHGTTMTGAKTPLPALRQAGYEINLLLCGAPEDVRADAQIYRATVQGFYQSTPEDVRAKGLAFPQKMQEYFSYGHNLTLFWRNGVTENAIKCATYERAHKTVLDQDGYDAFVAQYEKSRRDLRESAEPIGLPTFDQIEEIYKQRFVFRPTIFGLGPNPS